MLTSSLWTNKSIPAHSGSWGRTVWEKAGGKDGVSVITAAGPRWPSYLQHTALASSVQVLAMHSLPAAVLQRPTVASLLLVLRVYSQQRGKHPGAWVDVTQLILKFSTHGRLPSCPTELCPLLGTVRYH